MSFFLSRDPVTGASAVVLCTKASSGDLLYIGPQYTRSWDLSCFSKPLYKNTEAFYNNIGFTTSRSCPCAHACATRHVLSTFGETPKRANTENDGIPFFCMGSQRIAPGPSPPPQN